MVKSAERISMEIGITQSSTRKEKEGIMKKLIKLGLCAAAAAVMVTGCGNGKDTETTETTKAAESTETVAETKSEAELTDEASITAGNYLGLSMSAKKADVTDEMVENQLNTLMNQYPATVEGRAAELGDTANIDYVGTKDGEAFAGGTGTGYDLKLGSGTFIPGFEDGVVGMKTGEEKDLNLSFPDDYGNGNSELAGQAVVFHVTLNAIKSVEETKVDDALAKRVLGDENASLEDLKKQVTSELEAQLENRFFNEAGSELLAQAIANSEITVDPDASEDMYNQLINTYTGYAAQYGIELSDFLSMFLGTDEEGLKNTAEDLVKQEMMLNEIIKNEKLTPTDEQKESLAKMNYFVNAAQMMATYGEESANRLFEMGAAYYFLMDNAVVVDVPETTAAETAAEATDAAAETTAEGASDAAAETAAETSAPETTAAK